MLKQIYGLRVAVPGSVTVDGNKPVHSSQLTKSRYMIYNLVILSIASVSLSSVKQSIRQGSLEE
jgi:hypothetical protein